MLNWFKPQTKQKPFKAEIAGASSEGAELDPFSATWRYVRDVIELEIDTLRIKNDSPALSEAQTLVLRGKIKALKKVLALPEQAGKGILNRGNNINEPGNRLKSPTAMTG